MSDLPASHYVKIYRGRIDRAERGVAHPTPAVLARAKKLLRELENGDSSRPIRLEKVGQAVVFHDVSAGTKIGSLDFDFHEKA